MGIPVHWVERIFDRLSVRYGRDFLARWDGIAMADVKTDWAFELGGFERQPEAIAWALENLPDGRPPTAGDFRSLCRRAPAPATPLLPEPKADPARLRAELAKLAPIVEAARRGDASQQDGREWARRIMARHEAGERLNGYTLFSARMALGLCRADGSLVSGG